MGFFLFFCENIIFSRRVENKLPMRYRRVGLRDLPRTKLFPKFGEREKKKLDLERIRVKVSPKLFRKHTSNY